MDLKKLLNPVPCEARKDNQIPRSPATIFRSMTPSINNRRQKIPKDAPIFSEGNRTIGHVNFGPHVAEEGTELIDHHRQFSVFPLGEIERKGVRHIPYNSDKKDFLEKTGRDAFEVFQYTYKRPGEDKEYTVIWDYNVGLVRMTPFFKSCKYSKTIPAKALKENPGLKEISYSITGGALVCQGYWMPYHAARAVAATFCWDIRWALTPVFGNDFPNGCRRPNDPSFANFKIDPEVVRFCVAETEKFKTQGSSYCIVAEKTALSYEIANTQRGSPSFNIIGSRCRISRPIAMNMAYDESGYGTDTDRSDMYLMSPEISPRSRLLRQPLSPRSRPASVYSQFTPVNRARSRLQSPTAMCFSKLAASVTQRTIALSHMVDSPYAIAPVDDRDVRTKRTHSKIATADADGDAQASSTAQLHTSGDGVRYDSGQESEECAHESRLSGSDLDAAETLLCLSGAVKYPPSKRTRHESSH